jgi:hypothetical protein
VVRAAGCNHIHAARSLWPLSRITPRIGGCHKACGNATKPVAIASDSRSRLAVSWAISRLRPLASRLTRFLAWWCSVFWDVPGRVRVPDGRLGASFRPTVSIACVDGRGKQGWAKQSPKWALLDDRRKVGDEFGVSKNTTKRDAKFAAAASSFSTRRCLTRNSLIRGLDDAEFGRVATLRLRSANCCDSITHMTTKPLKWHGGKHYLARQIIDLMPPHTHYVEPFFGGGSVLFAKPFDGVSEVVNDLDGELTNFWQVLRSPELFERFYRVV